WRAAAEEDAGDPAAGRKRRPMPQLAQIRAQVSRLVDPPGPHMAVEVAIGALGGAERPVHVDAETGIALSRLRPRQDRRGRTAGRRGRGERSRAWHWAPSR